jgi:hypothetical protein
MTSEHRGETARGRQRPGLVLLCLIASALLPVLAACSSPVHYSTGAPAPTSSPSSNPYRRFDQDVTKLVERQAEWQAPKRLKANETARIGLVIGDPSRLKTEIRGLVPGSYPKHAGRVKVGSTISVQLTTYSGDASVTPSDAIDNSLGEHTALLFTWYVHPKHPDTAPGLFLTAEVVTKMSDGHVLRQELYLVIPVDRTLQYTMYQVFTNWGTWAAIVTAVSGAAAGIWRWRKRKQKTKQPKTRPKAKQPAE